MTERLKQLRLLTKGFNEVQQLIADHNALKKQIRAVDRKLTTIESKYGFLNDITSIDGKDIVIEIAAKQLFKSAGFRQVRHLQNARPKREDLQIWCDDCIILAECKGSKYSVPSDNEIGQVLKYINFRKNTLKSELPVFGLTIINHDNSKPIDKRNKKPIDKNKDEYAKAGQYGIITTIELAKGFVMLKNNNITFEQFKNTIKQHGLITFGVGADKP